MQPSIPWSSSVSIFVIERMTIIHSLKCTVPFSLVVPLLSLAVAHCYLLSLVVTCCHSLSLLVTRCTTLCHSLSFVFTRGTTRCHSLSFVDTSQCPTRLSFYKQSLFPFLMILFPEVVDEKKRFLFLNNCFFDVSLQNKKEYILLFI